VISKDSAIRYHPHELKALKRGNVRAFILGGGNLSADDMARVLVKALPRMDRVVRITQPPFVARVRAGGTVSVIR
jgi:hypothetical protein